MEVSLAQANEVSDLCIGKPALSSLPLSATVGDALLALRSGQGDCISVCGCDAAAASDPVSPTEEEKEEEEEAGFCPVVGKVCTVDVLCYLCSDENISSPAAALDHPVSALLPKGAATVRRVESNSSILEALDVILDGAQTLVVPIRSTALTKEPAGEAADFCWLTYEDFARFFLNSIAFFSAVADLSVTELGLVRPPTLVVRHQDPVLSAVPLVRAALSDQTSVAVVTDDGRLVGEISPSTLAHCDESVAPALAALSAADFMAYVDCFGSPPESILQSIKSGLKGKGFGGMLEFLEIDHSPSSSSSSTSSSCSSSSDEESSAPSSPGRRPPRRLRSGGWSGSYSARMGRRSEEAIVCHPTSSLVAVMIQALAHRVSYVWVVDDDHFLAGIVGFSDILQVFRDQLAAN